MYTCITNGHATHLVRSKGTIYHQVLLKLKYQLAWHLKIVSGKQNSFLFVCGAGGVTKLIIWSCTRTVTFRSLP